MNCIELPIEGMTCQHCVRTVKGALASVPGVRSAEVSLERGTAVVDVDDGRPSREELASAVANAGYSVPDEPAPNEPAAAEKTTNEQVAEKSPARQPEHLGQPAGRRERAAPVSSHGNDVLLDIEGMTCASCVARVERALNSVPGVRGARANLATNQASVEFDAPGVEMPALLEAVARSGYAAAPAPTSEAGADLARRGARELAGWRLRLLAAVALLAPIVVIHFVAPPGGIWAWMQLILATMLQGYVGWPFYLGAVRRARHFSANMDTLVAIGTSAAWLAGVYAMVFTLDPTGSHSKRMDLMDAGIILTFMTLGKYLEARAKGRASAAIRKLLDLAPPVANVEREGRLATVPPGQVAEGETIVVRPGEKVPLDAEIVSGESTVDESWLTGESMPVEKSRGSEILAGTINGQGSLKARVLRVEGHTALAQVVDLVRRAQESKTEVQRLADQVVGWFVPVVLLTAAATLIAWGLLGQDWFSGIECMVAVLVVACPCALGLATPTAILVAGGRGAELGILIKEAHALEVAGRVTIVVLDKTGTVTIGKPELIDVVPFDGVSADELLATAAAVEEHSQHPLAAPIRAAAGEQGLTLPKASDLQVVPGQGVLARGETGWLAVGNERLLEAQGVDYSKHSEQIESLRAAGRSPLFVARDGRLLGLVVVADKVAPHSRDAVERLKHQGLKVMLLSGDRQAIAQRVAGEVGIERIEAEVLPDAKQTTIHRLQSEGEIVAMVGDGINDAPALAAADLGIAVGSGSDIAVEAADVVIVGDDLRAVARTLALARATLRTIRQNLLWAFGYNVVLIPVAAGAMVPWFGWRLPAVAAAAAMALSSVSVVTNSLLLRVRSVD